MQQTYLVQESIEKVNSNLLVSFNLDIFFGATSQKEIPVSVKDTGILLFIWRFLRSKIRFFAMLDLEFPLLFPLSVHSLDKSFHPGSAFTLHFLGDMAVYIQGKSSGCVT